MPAPHAEIVPHGTLDYSELRALGLQPEELIHFSSNINPFGPPPATVAAVRAAITPELVARYPDRLSLELRDLLAGYHQLTPENILVGNGTADLMWLIGLLFLQRRRVAILAPTFGEYHNVANLMQAEVVEVCHPGWRATQAGYAPGANTVAEVAHALRKSAAEVVFVCNPNNPTGAYLDHDALEELYAALPQALWIADEAYAEFRDPPTTTAAWAARPNWLVLRSMTKDYALGGLRLGYLVGVPELVRPLQTAQSPWNVNTFAQLAGCVSLHEGQQWRRETLARLRAETATLQQGLVALGYQPLPTTVSYFLVPVKSAAELRQELLAKRIVVRDCTSFGLPNFIRIATQRPEANSLLLDALAELGPRHLPDA